MEWRRLAEGADDERIEAVLAEHPEVRILWGRPGLPDHLDIGGVDPILHVLIEAVAERQVRLGEPPEAAEALSRLQGMGLRRHTAVGSVARLLLVHMGPVLRRETPFDSEGFRRRLGMLGRVNIPRAGRNSSCVCGSGKKFKKCCLSLVHTLTIDPAAGTLLLGRGDYVLVADPDQERALQMENRAAIAGFLEAHGDLEGALQCLRENVECAELAAGHGHLLRNALEELRSFCYNGPEFSVLGVKVTDRLLGLPGEDDELGEDAAGLDDEEALLRCDRADMLARAGQAGEAEAEYEALRSRLSGDEELLSLVQYRYGLWLEDQGRTEEAEQTLAALLDGDGEFHLEISGYLLAEIWDKAGRKS